MVYSGLCGCIGYHARGVHYPMYFLPKAVIESAVPAYSFVYSFIYLFIYLFIFLFIWLLFQTKRAMEPCYQS